MVTKVIFFHFKSYEYLKIIIKYWTLTSNGSSLFDHLSYTLQKQDICEACASLYGRTHETGAHSMQTLSCTGPFSGNVTPTHTNWTDTRLFIHLHTHTHTNTTHTEYKQRLSSQQAHANLLYCKNVHKLTIPVHSKSFISRATYPEVN